MLHLTLRTLLAYLDDTLDPRETRDIGRQLAEAPKLQELIDRIRAVLHARDPEGSGGAGPTVDPNTVAAYLDNMLPAEEVVALETLCLESDRHLAEVAAAHQILTVADSEPVQVPPLTHQAMYALAPGREASPTRTPPRPRLREDEADQPEPRFLGLPLLPLPLGDGPRLVPLAAVLVILLVGVSLALFTLTGGPRMPFAPATGPEVAAASRPVDDPRQRAVHGVPPAPPPGPATAPGTLPAPAPVVAAAPHLMTMWDWPGADLEVKREPRFAALASSVLDWSGFLAARYGTPAYVLVLREKALAGAPAEAPVAAAPPPDKAPPGAALPAVAPPAAGKPEVAQFLPAVTKESLLLVRRTAPDEWYRVKPSSRLKANELLVGLPGFRNELVVDRCGLQVQLVGTLPVYGTTNWVAEAAVTFHPPDKDVDADLTLERGRIVLSNKRAEPVRIRLRFADQAWEVRLLQPTSKVGLELFGRVPPGSGAWQPVYRLQFLTLDGDVDLKRGPAVETIPGGQQFTWTSTPAAAQVRNPPVPIAAKEHPGWFKAPFRPGYPDVQTAQVLTFQRQLSEKDPEGKWLVEGCREVLAEGKALEKYLALFTLAAMDQLPLVLANLDDGPIDVCRMAFESLIHFVGRRPGQDQVLLPILRQNDYSPEDAATLLQLLRRIDQPKRETFLQLVSLLNHPRRSFRDVAYGNNLLSLVPADLLASAKYDPNAPPEARERSIQIIKAKLKLQ